MSLQRHIAVPQDVRLESLTYKDVRLESLTYKDVRLESLTYES